VKKIKIKSSFMTRIGRLEPGVEALAVEAFRGVMAGTDPAGIGRIYLASYAPGDLCGVTDPLRSISLALQSEYPGLRAAYHGVFKTGGEALYHALENVSSERKPGVTGQTVVLGVEKMTHLPPAETAGILSNRENPHDRAYGATLPALGALVTQSYLQTHGIPEDALHLVAVKNHFHGAMNPNAHFQKTVTIDDVASSPLVADPLRRLHCAPVSDGAAAVLLDTDEGDVWYRGWGKGTDVQLFQDRADISRFTATAEAAANACAMAGVSPADADLVEIHDAFTSFELINFEEMGFLERGSAWKLLADGGMMINSPIAVNSSGGMKARGHPIGCTAVSGSVEVHEQLTGRAGERQHRDARLGMIQSVGGVSNESFVFVIDSLDGKIGGTS
jgi:acetyl-CoA acetyltransferase